MATAATAEPESVAAETRHGIPNSVLARVTKLDSFDSAAGTGRASPSSDSVTPLSQSPSLKNRDGQHLWKVAKTAVVAQTRHESPALRQWTTVMNQLMVPANWSWLWHERKSNAVLILDKLEHLDQQSLEAMKSELQSTLYSLRQKKALDDDEKRLQKEIAQRLKEIEQRTRELRANLYANISASNLNSMVVSPVTKHKDHAAESSNSVCGLCVWASSFAKAGQVAGK